MGVVGVKGQNDMMKIGQRDLVGKTQKKRMLMERLVLRACMAA